MNRRLRLRLQLWPRANVIQPYCYDRTGALCFPRDLSHNWRMDGPRGLRLNRLLSARANSATARHKRSVFR